MKREKAEAAKIQKEKKKFERQEKARKEEEAKELEHKELERQELEKRDSEEETCQAAVEAQQPADQRPQQKTQASTWPARIFSALVSYFS